MPKFDRYRARTTTYRNQSISVVSYWRVDNHHMHMHDLTGFQRDLLYVIAGLDEPHGLAVKEELEEYYETEIHHGRLYPNLDTLVEKGLIDKGKLDKRTNIYTVARRGHREIESRKEWEQKYTSESKEVETPSA